MDIPYNVRHSDYVGPCEEVIRSGQTRLMAGEPIEISLDAEKAGYGRIIEVEISDDATTFGSDWANADSTRFPARIKAAKRPYSIAGVVGDFLSNITTGW